MRRLIMLIFICLLSVVAGCNTNSKWMTRSDQGMLLGGIGGAGLGAAVSGGSALGVGIGAVGGAYIGKKIIENN